MKLRRARRHEMAGIVVAGVQLTNAPRTAKVPEQYASAVSSDIDGVADISLRPIVLFERWRLRADRTHGAMVAIVEVRWMMLTRTRTTIEVFRGNDREFSQA